jgi:hypothetical protein
MSPVTKAILKPWLNSTWFTALAVWSAYNAIQDARTNDGDLWIAFWVVMAIQCASRAAHYANNVGATS